MPHPSQPAILATAPRCGARTRSGAPCRAPAVNGNARCRMHGGKGSGAPRGNRNAWKHGTRSAWIRAVAAYLRATSPARMKQTLGQAPQQAVAPPRPTIPAFTRAVTPAAGKPATRPRPTTSKTEKTKKRTLNPMHPGFLRTARNNRRRPPGLPAGPSPSPKKTCPPPKHVCFAPRRPNRHVARMVSLLDPEARGRVILVGAGPGDPGLLTLRAVDALRQADVVVHDGLIDMRVLDYAPEGAQRISVAKQRDRHTLPQEAINALIIAHVKAGSVVVRLKGGDPFVFGRGGEEVEAVRAAGLPVEVVPGVSSALGCAAEAMLPLTHRDWSSAVSFVAGTCKGLTEQDWAGLAGQGRTLVIYMGVTCAGPIADKLMADGVAPDMPVAVLERGTLEGSRAMRTLLADLGDMVRREKVISPAIIVVGEVVDLSDAENRLGALAAQAERMKDHA